MSMIKNWINDSFSYNYQPHDKNYKIPENSR